MTERDRVFHLYYPVPLGRIMAVATANLHHILGNLACSISQLSSADVEITVNIEFKNALRMVPDKRNFLLKYTRTPHFFSDHPTPELDNLASFRKMVPNRKIPNIGFSAEDGNELKTEELFPEARITDNRNI
ncbi:hypothetical protein DINM_002458 [Dirofilaria immitis]|nr:hypothetical protein [Dirofilaria immitis]